MPSSSSLNIPSVWGVQEGGHIHILLFFFFFQSKLSWPYPGGFLPRAGGSFGGLPAEKPENQHTTSRDPQSNRHPQQQQQHLHRRLCQEKRVLPLQIWKRASRRRATGRKNVFFRFASRFRFLRISRVKWGVSDWLSVVGGERERRKWWRFSCLICLFDQNLKQLTAVGSGSVACSFDDWEREKGERASENRRDGIPGDISQRKGRPFDIHLLLKSPKSIEGSTCQLINPKLRARRWKP